MLDGRVSCESCGHEIDIHADSFIELNMPNRFLAFCEMKCLKEWINSPTNSSQKATCD